MIDGTHNKYFVLVLLLLTRGGGRPNMGVPNTYYCEINNHVFKKGCAFIQQETTVFKI